MLEVHLHQTNVAKEKKSSGSSFSLDQVDPSQLPSGYNFSVETLLPDPSKAVPIQDQISTVKREGTSLVRLVTKVQIGAIEDSVKAQKQLKLKHKEAMTEMVDELLNEVKSGTVPTREGMLAFNYDTTYYRIHEKLNAADSLIFQTEKQLKDYGDKISEDNKKPIDEALAKLKEVHASGDLAAIDLATEALNKVWESASQEIYAAQASAEASSAGSEPSQETSEGEGKTDQDVSDVEYEEVDDKK